MLTAGPTGTPPLTLLQGMAGSAILGHHQLVEFDHRHRVFAVDTVGQPGRSAPNPPSIVRDEYALWLLNLLDGLNQETAHMAGISSGGWGIILLGIQHPERLDKAVLLSPLRLARARLNGRRWVGNALKKDTEDDALADRLTVRDFSPDSKGRPYDQRLARAMALATRHYRLSFALGVEPNSLRLQKTVQGLRAIAFFSSPAKRFELAQFTPRWLVVLGEHEALYNPHRAAQRTAVMPRACLEIVPEAGHAAVFDRPEYINPIIVDFLEER